MERNVLPLHRQQLPLARQGRVAPGSALPTHFGDVSEPVGNVIRPRRFVRPLDNLRAAQSMGDQPLVDLFDGFRKGDELRKRLAKRRLWQRRIGVACCILSALTVLWFLFQLGRGVL